MESSCLEQARVLKKLDSRFRGNDVQSTRLLSLFGAFLGRGFN
jgi:hypothetical protein